MRNYLSWVEIDKKALINNIFFFKKLIGSEVKLLAVVKGNAYGHGLKEVVKIIQNRVDWFGVNNLEEALVIKNLGIGKPILILGYTPDSQLQEVAKNNFRQVVYNKQTAIQLFKLSNYRPKVHLKIETGTNRQGIEGEELLAIAEILAQNPKIEIEGAYTHFANVEESEDFVFPKEQITRFKKQIKILEKTGIKIPLKHTACTAATIFLPESHFDMIRLGIGLYGLWPSELTRNLAIRRGIKLDLKPVLTWKTVIAQVKKVKKGETIGYGRDYKATKEIRIAILPVGYYDGYDRHLSYCGRVLIKGQFAPIIGRVMMNMIIVDITDIGGVKIEDEVVLIGKQGKNEISADELAKKIGSINYEIVTRINPLLPRIWI